MTIQVPMGGGGGLPINSLTAINTPDLLHTANDGTVWLRTGVIEDDIASYPDATVGGGKMDGANYSGNSFSVNAQEAFPSGITWDGTYFWVVGTGADTVYQYTDAFIYTGFSFSVATELSFPKGITWDGEHLWLVGSTQDSVYKYLPDGTYTGVSFSVAGQDTAPTGICWDGSHFWVSGGTNDTIYKYELDGTYTGVSFTTVAANPTDVLWDGMYFWVPLNTSVVHQYSSSGSSTGVSFSTASEGAPAGIAWDGTSFIATSQTPEGTLYQYTPTYSPEHVGVSAATNGTSGIPNYTRIK